MPFIYLIIIDLFDFVRTFNAKMDSLLGQENSTTTMFQNVSTWEEAFLEGTPQAAVRGKSCAVSLGGSSERRVEVFWADCSVRSLRSMNSLTIVILTGSETDCRLTEANNFLL